MEAELVISESPTPNETAIMTRAQKLLETAERAVIDSPERYAQAVTLAKLISTAAALAEDERILVTGPINQGLKRINERFKAAFGTPLGKAGETIRSKMLTFRQEQEKQARAEALEAERLRLAELAKMAEESKKAMAEGDTRKITELQTEIINRPELTRPVAPPMRAAPVKGVAGGTAGTQKRWTYEIEDLSKVPPHFLSLNDKMVKAAIADGKREIAGLRIFQEESIVVR